MEKELTVTFNVEEETLEQAEAVISDYGVSIDSVFKSFLTNIAKSKRLPSSLVEDALKIETPAVLTPEFISSKLEKKLPAAFPFVKELYAFTHEDIAESDDSDIHFRLVSEEGTSLRDVVNLRLYLEELFHSTVEVLEPLDLTSPMAIKIIERENCIYKRPSAI